MNWTSRRSPSSDATRPVAPCGLSSPSTTRSTRVTTSVPAGSGTAAGSRSSRPPSRSAISPAKRREEPLPVGGVATPALDRQRAVAEVDAITVDTQLGLRRERELLAERSEQREHHDAIVGE